MTSSRKTVVLEAFPPVFSKSTLSRLTAPPLVVKLSMPIPGVVPAAVSEALQLYVYCVHVEVSAGENVPQLNPPADKRCADTERFGDPLAAFAQKDILYVPLIRTKRLIFGEESKYSLTVAEDPLAPAFI